MARNKRKKHNKKQNKLLQHLVSLGFTNRLAICLVLFLLIGLAGGFYLAVKSIEYNYVGALACWTIVFTPIGTAIGIVLGQIVNKNKAENISGGYRYEQVVAEINNNVDSPCI